MKIGSTYRRLLATASVIVAATVLYSCKDFLTEAATPQGTLDEGTLANRVGVEGSLIAAYRSLDCTYATQGSGWGCAASNWVYGSVVSDDSYAGSTPNDQPGVNDLEAYAWANPGAQNYLGQKWQTVYEGVVRANSTLRLLAEVKAASPGEFSTADANGIEGEAIFLRAHYHFEAWRMWGNIPYYREDDTDFRKANLTSDEVAVELLKDLDSAIGLLPASPRNGEKGRATQWTAKAYKGRVQVYAGQFADAVTTLQEVATGGPYALETSFDHVWTGFSQYANGPETIFAYQASVNDGEPNGENGNFGETLNFPYAGDFGCCGFNQPTQNLINFFQVDANGLPLAETAPATWNASDADFAAGNLTPVDPRLDWTVGRDSVPFKDWGLYSLEGGWVRSIENGGFYSAKKNVHEKAAGASGTVGWNASTLNSVNIQLFRYADLLLLLAEAEVETGQLEAARAIVNQIRDRAGQTAQGCGVSADTDVDVAYPQCAGDTRLAVPIDDPSITWASYRIGQYLAPWTDPTYAREAVRNERRIELAMEGQRFFDLRRWGIGQAAIQGYLTGVGGGREDTRRLYLAQGEPYGAKHRWYPIPTAQIELSKVGGQETLKQNTGW